MQGRRSLHTPLVNPLEKPKRKRRESVLPEVEDVEQQLLDSSSLEEESSTESRSSSLANTREEELDTSLGSIKLEIEPVQGPPKVHERPSPLISPILQPFINQPNTPTYLFIEEPPNSPTSLQFGPFNKTLTFHDMQNPPKPCSMQYPIKPTFQQGHSIPLSSSYMFIEWPPPNFPFMLLSKLSTDSSCLNLCLNTFGSSHLSCPNTFKGSKHN